MEKLLAQWSGLSDDAQVLILFCAAAQVLCIYVVAYLLNQYDIRKENYRRMMMEDASEE
tara:strand:- start:314 stop:490 length:177 start_codon:yes stop_codon:yes gene_type:complete